MSECNRIVVLIDMDCFYVQVEQRRNPEIRNKPCAVVQYNKWKGGGIIAVSYEARAKGVSRNMRGDDAKEKCPDIVLCMVPTANGKADLTRYRDAGAEVIKVLLQFSGIVERASIDEAYIDLTKVVEDKMVAIKKNENKYPSLSDLPHTYVVGFPRISSEVNSDNEEKINLGTQEYVNCSTSDENALRLLIAAALVEDIRLAIYEQTSFRCSAGVAHNKVLSKLACGINKPNKQTILPMESVPSLFSTIGIRKIRNLGGKLGFQVSQNYGIENIGQLASIPKTILLKDFGSKTGDWLFDICRGIDHEPVKERHVAQSVGCSKNFTGSDALKSRPEVQRWIGCLVNELVERLTKDQYVNNRVSRGLTVHVGLPQQRPISRSCQISQYDVAEISRSIMSTLELLNKSSNKQTDQWNPPITMIGISAGKFKDFDINVDKQQPKLKLSPRKLSSSNEKNHPKPTDIFPSEPVISHFFAKQSKNLATIASEQPSTETTPQMSVLANPVSPKRTSFTTMDKKRHFFSKNFGSADKNETTTEENDEPAVEKKSTLCKLNSSSKVTKPEVDGRKSFFATIRKKNSPSCKIESAFDNLTNKESSQSNEQDDKFVTVFQNAKEKDKSDSPLNENARGTSDADVLYCMDEVDMEVFNSLPLYLQQEIKFSSRKKDSSRVDSTGAEAKRPKLAPPCGQTSISGFFNFTSGNPASVKPSPRKNVAAKKGKMRKAATMQHSCLGENSVPFGFFRARTHASAAIRSAVEQQLQQSQKKKPTRDENRS